MTFNYKIIHLIKLEVFALLCFLLFSNQSLSQNINGYLLFEESKNETASKCELYSSSELNTNSEVTFKIIFSTDSPSPLGKYNQLGAGLAALIVPEDAYVYYKKIKIYYSIYPDREEYKEYKPSSESEKNWWKFVELVISKIPYIGMVTDLKPFYEYSKPDYDNKIDGNEYDMVSADWDTKKLENWRKVKIEIPVRIGQNTNIGLYAFWLTKASNESGPVYQRENIVSIGLLDEIATSSSNYPYSRAYNYESSGNSLEINLGIGEVPILTEGLACNVYRGTKKIASGYISSVGEDQSSVEISEFYDSYQIEAFDEVEILVKHLQNKSGPKENFNDFIVKYFNDKNFHFNRTIFPLKFVSEYPETPREIKFIQREEWKFVKNGFEGGESMFYRAEEKGNQIVFYCLCSGCGIKFIYTFEYRENKLFCVMYEDYST